jgi:hypothetical protein
MKSILVKLAQIGDSLDEAGHYTLANEIDFIIMKYSGPPDLTQVARGGEITVESPKDEVQLIRDILANLDGDENSETSISP